MSQTELHLSALQRLIDGHAGSGADLRRLRCALTICRDLFAALEDEYCRRKLLVVEEYAAELLCAGQPRDYLRQRIREALELVQSRLYSLERSWLFGKPAPGHSLTARFAG